MKFPSKTVERFRDAMLVRSPYSVEAIGRAFETLTIEDLASVPDNDFARASYDEGMRRAMEICREQNHSWTDDPTTVVSRCLKAIDFERMAGLKPEKEEG